MPPGGLLGPTLRGSHSVTICISNRIPSAAVHLVWGHHLVQACKRWLFPAVTARLPCDPQHYTPLVKITAVLSVSLTAPSPAEPGQTHPYSNPLEPHSMARSHSSPQGCG